MGERATWLKALVEAQFEAGDAVAGRCPNCGQERLHARYIGDPDSRIGYVLFWCEACLHGISVSRVRAPEGVSIWPFEDPAAIVGVPDFQRDD